MTSAGGTPAPEAVITAAGRAESVRLIAAIIRMTGDVSLAEDLVQDALVAALEQWARDGISANPGAWLMAVAKRRAVDHFRQSATERRRLADIGQSLQENRMPDLHTQVDYIEDDVLRLIFLTCHPVLTPESRADLTLRLVGGLTTADIAAAFLVKDTAMGQRISRAQRTLAESGVTFAEPIGFDTVQAAIAACHAQARIPEDRDWRRIASLYDLLAELAPNPVVEVNRALALGRAYGPDAGLTILAQLDKDSTLSGSHLVPGVRGDLLALAGRSAEAVAEFLALRRSLETSGNGTSCSGEQSC